MNLMTLPLQEIVLNAGTQSRVRIDYDTVKEYAEALRDGINLPPVTVCRTPDSRFVLVDGFHRWHAHREAGLSEITSSVITGTVRDALVMSLGVNSDHGLRRTNADKRAAVLTALRDPELRQMSDHKIAAMCRVTQPFVSGLRKEIYPPNAEPLPADAAEIYAALEGRYLNTLILSSGFEDGILKSFGDDTTRPLVRLGLLDPLGRADDGGNMTRITELGRRVVEACRADPVYQIAKASATRDALKALYDAAGWVGNHPGSAMSYAVRSQFPLLADEGYALVDKTATFGPWYAISAQGCAALGRDPLIIPPLDDGSAATDAVPLTGEDNPPAFDGDAALEDILGGPINPELAQVYTPPATDNGYHRQPISIADSTVVTDAEILSSILMDLEMMQQRAAELYDADLRDRLASALADALDLFKSAVMPEESIDV